ncbi:hypothetical protein [Bradyrhizobium icense]|uniref:Uncharacterized protein n=1 Tax=Bradyrhizobium icense TaxID=1274631 RepID=A0A1B1U9D5_9BRAD|nr:hypothetical protein [Bradyrhizobium icense]ANV99351.1 hypothetical protein LMTR13_03320 [Bradyrhizobium icense]
MTQHRTPVRVSAAEWLKAHFEIPKWGALAMLGSGLVLMASGFGAPVSLQQDFPWIIIDASAQLRPTNWFVVVGGAAVSVIAALLMVPMFSNPTDGERPPKPPLTPPVVRLISPEIVEEESVSAMVERYGYKWPKTVIEWPPSCSELQAAIKKGQMLFDHADVSVLGADHFKTNAGMALERLPKRREWAETLLPSLVARVVHFEDHYRRLAIRNYLILANFEVHFELARLSSWLGLREASIEVPDAWKPYQCPDREAHLKRLLNGSSSKEIVNARLRVVGGKYIPNVGHYFNVPKSLAMGSRPQRADKEDICRWLIPQFHYQLSAQLPEIDRYDERWGFDKISGE